MIKNLKDISEKELAYLRTHPIEVYEKLDLLRFVVEIEDVDGSCAAVSVKTSKGHEINDVDCIVNTVMGDIMMFVNEIITPKGEEILDGFNSMSCKIHMFYAPVQCTHVVNYDKFDCPLFIMANVNVDYDYLDWVRNMMNVLGHVDHLSYLCPSNKLDCLPESIDIHGNNIENARFLIGKLTWSLNPVGDIEGCIITCGKKSYQIICNDTNIDVDRTTKKIYRDMVLDNFDNVVIDHPLAQQIFDKGGSYVDIMSGLFLLYLDKTTIFTRVSFDQEDLLPPHVGYIGDLDYDRVPVAVKYVCMTNPVYRNIFRILLVSFDPCRKKKSNDQDIDYEKFDQLKNQINKSVENIKTLC